MIYMKTKLLENNTFSCGVCNKDAYKWCSTCIDLPGEKFTLNPVQVSVLDYLKDGIKSFIVASGTGTGKTWCAFHAIRVYFQTNKNIVYILEPLKQLVHEKVAELIEMFPDKKVLELTGDTTDDVGFGRIRNDRILHSDIVVMSYEMFDSLTRKPSVYTADVGLIVIDEIHSIGSPSRGGTLDGAITRYMISHRPYVVCLSATFDNIGQLENYFKQFIDIKVITSDFKPIKVNVDPVIHSYERDQSDLILQIIDRCMSIPGGIMVMQLSIPASDKIASLINQTYGAGTAVAHYSELEVSEKYKVVDDFNEGKFKVICCTPTLLAGVNIAASCIILNLSYFDPIRMEPALLDPSSIKQAIGRVGRLPRYNEGYVTYICNKDLIDEAQSILASGNIIRGTLNNNLPYVINVEVSMNNILINDLYEWYGKTYSAFSDAKSEELFNKTLEFLIKFDYIKARGELLVSTIKGKACSKYFVNPVFYETCLLHLNDKKLNNTEELANFVFGTIFTTPNSPTNWNERKAKSFIDMAKNTFMFVDDKIDLTAPHRKLQWTDPINFAFTSIKNASYFTKDTILNYNADIICRCMHDSGMSVGFARIHRKLDQMGVKLKSRGFIAYLAINGFEVDENDQIVSLPKVYRTPSMASYSTKEEKYTYRSFTDAPSRYEKEAYKIAAQVR